jgi:hypothetical protein
MFKRLRNPFYRKVVLYSLIIVIALTVIGLVQAAWREFTGDVDRIFPGGNDRDDNVLNWGEPAPTRDGLPSVDDLDW